MHSRVPAGGTSSNGWPPSTRPCAPTSGRPPPFRKGLPKPDRGKVAAVFDALVGIDLTRGASAQIDLRTAARLEPDYHLVLDEVRTSEPIAADETGARRRAPRPAPRRGRRAGHRLRRRPPRGGRRPALGVGQPTAGGAGVCNAVEPLGESLRAVVRGRGRTRNRADPLESGASDPLGRGQSQGGGRQPGPRPKHRGVRSRNLVARVANGVGRHRPNAPRRRKLAPPPTGAANYAINEYVILFTLNSPTQRQPHLR